MASNKSSADHVENSTHEAALTGVIALASLFSNCVEAFGLIHPSHKWEKEEQHLLARLGLQQARLLIWGFVLGITSPPASVTDRAVPKNPSNVYPDLSEPTFFHARDARLDEPATRTKIENTLSAIVDRSAHATREEMMAKYGLKPPKRSVPVYEPALDTNRLEAFRERYELLREVAESYAHLNTRRSNSIVHTSWLIADCAKFKEFIKLTQDKVDYLIELTDVKDRVDRAMRMDIRSFGWHVVADRVRLAMDSSKLRVLEGICTADYPEYSDSIEQALANITREQRENGMAVKSYPRAASAECQSGANGHLHPPESKKRPGLLKIFRSFGKPKDHTSSGRSLSTSEPVRSMSDFGPTFTNENADLDDVTSGPPRSKSVGGEAGSLHVNSLATELEKIRTKEAIRKEPDTKQSGFPVVTRHDQYHGIARTATNDLHQPGGGF